MAPCWGGKVLPNPWTFRLMGVFVAMDTVPRVLSNRLFLAEDFSGRIFFSNQYLVSNYFTLFHNYQPTVYHFYYLTEHYLPCLFLPILLSLIRSSCQQISIFTLFSACVLEVLNFDWKIAQLKRFVFFPERLCLSRPLVHSDSLSCELGRKRWWKNINNHNEVIYKPQWKLELLNWNVWHVCQSGTWQETLQGPRWTHQFLTKSSNLLSYRLVTRLLSFGYVVVFFVCFLLCFGHVFNSSPREVCLSMRKMITLIHFSC